MKGSPAELFIGGGILAAGTIFAGKAAYDRLRESGDLTDEESARIEQRLADPLARSHSALREKIDNRGA